MSFRVGESQDVLEPRLKNTTRLWRLFVLGLIRKVLAAESSASLVRELDTYVLDIAMFN